MDFTNLLLFALRVTDLTDYEGGESKLLVYIALGFAVFLIGGAIFAAIKRKHQALRYYLYTLKVQLTAEEKAFLSNMFRRSRLENHLEVISNRQAFQKFAAKVAHHYEHADLTEAELLDVVALFTSIRQKLGFPLADNSKDVHTSRALPVGTPLEITITDSALPNQIQFSSCLISNGDFFLGINPPSPEIAKSLPNKKRLEVQVHFQTANGNSCRFKSLYLRTIDHPQTIWILRHSGRLDINKGTQVMKLRSQITATSEDGAVNQLPGLITSLSNKSCIFATALGQSRLDDGTGVLVNFEADSESLTFRAAVEETIERPSSVSYRLNFTGLDQEEEKLLIHFAHKQKKALKKTSE